MANIIIRGIAGAFLLVGGFIATVEGKNALVKSLDDLHKKNNK